MASSSPQMSKLDKACKDLFSVLPQSGSRSPSALNGLAEFASFMPLEDGSLPSQFMYDYRKRFTRIKQPAPLDPSKPTDGPEPTRAVRPFKKNHVVRDPDWTPTLKRPPPTDVKTILNGIREISNRTQSQNVSRVLPANGIKKTIPLPPKKTSEPIKKPAPPRPTTGGKSIKLAEMKMINPHLRESDVDFFLVRRFLPLGAEDPIASRRVEHLRVIAKASRLKPAASERSKVKTQKTSTAISKPESSRPDEMLRSEPTKRGTAKPEPIPASSVSKQPKKDTKKQISSSSATKTNAFRSEPRMSEPPRRGSDVKPDAASRAREKIRPEPNVSPKTSSKSKPTTRAEPPMSDTRKPDPRRTESRRPATAKSNGSDPDARRPEARRPDLTRPPTAKKRVSNSGNTRPVLRIHIAQTAADPDARGSQKPVRAKPAHIPTSSSPSSDRIPSSKKPARTVPPSRPTLPTNNTNNASPGHDQYMPVTIPSEFIRSMKIPKRRPPARGQSRKEDGELEEGETISPSPSPSSSLSPSTPKTSPKRRHAHDDDRDDGGRHPKGRRQSYHRDDERDHDERRWHHRSLEARHGAPKENRRRENDPTEDAYRKRQKPNGESRRAGRHFAPERQRRRSSDLTKAPKDR